MTEYDRGRLAKHDVSSKYPKLFGAGKKFAAPQERKKEPNIH